MLRIGEFSKLTKMTVKALRYYDKLGLLKPAFVDGDTAYRYYTENQLADALQIQTYKSAGLSCEDIRLILSDKADTESLLLAHKHHLQAAQAEINRQLTEIESLLHTERSQTYVPCIKNIAGCQVYCSKTFISDISKIRDFILLTMQELKRTNPDVGFPSPDYCCVIYPGKNYRESNIFVEYVQSVDKPGIDTPVVKFKWLEPITAVSVMHAGKSVLY